MKRLSTDLDTIQRVVANWSSEVHGHVTSEPIIAKLHEEVDELEDACNLKVCLAEEGTVHSDVDPAIGSEIADVAIVLLVLCHQQGMILSDLIAAKHEVNLGRTFARQADGTYRHV